MDPELTYSSITSRPGIHYFKGDFLVEGLDEGAKSRNITKQGIDYNRFIM